MRLIHLDVVCLASEDALHAAQIKHKALPGQSGYVLDPLWRQIKVRGSDKALLVELASVNEVPAVSGLPQPGVDNANYGFSWEDLKDSSFICKMLAREHFAVATRVIRILDSVHKNQVALHQKLAVQA